jgi:hypothetical protein
MNEPGTTRIEDREGPATARRGLRRNGALSQPVGAGNSSGHPEQAFSRDVIGLIGMPFGRNEVARGLTHERTAPAANTAKRQDLRRLM